MPTPRANSDPSTVPLGGVLVSRLGLAETISLMGDWLDDPMGRRRVATANLDFLALAHDNEQLQQTLLLSDLVTADGAPLVWLSHLAGEPIAERVAGADFVVPLIGEAARRGRSVYFLGGSDEAGKETIEILRERFPELIVAGQSAPMVNLAEVDDCRAVARSVAESGADLVLVGFGCPKQDFFIHHYLPDMNCRLAIGVGGTFNFITGRVRRAPAIWQKLGLEWFFRWMMEPRRLLGRYLNDARHLLRLVVQSKRYRGLGLNLPRPENDHKSVD